MSTNIDDIASMAVTILRSMVGERIPDDAEIAQAVDTAIGALGGLAGSDLDRGRVIAEVESREANRVGRAQKITSQDPEHRSWVRGIDRSEWGYWRRCREYALKQYSRWLIDELDLSTDDVLDELEDPKRAGAWDRRGMVVGNIQSGKTTHFTALMNKAMDAGYNVIIVLSGMHNNLRTQTQVRVEEWCLGYQKLTGDDGDVSRKVVGVGAVNGALRPSCPTHKGERGDFLSKAYDAMGVTPSEAPLVLVVKKNKTPLENLLKWAAWVARAEDWKSGFQEQEARLLIIDDECDQASVDTGNQQRGQDGEVDPEYSPKTINRLIRRLLNSFSKSAYVGYTATPFSNIFIHRDAETELEGADLFPRHFIVNLETPNTYVGANRIFGLGGDDDGNGLLSGLPILRDVTDHAASLSLGEREGWVPPKHDKSHRPLFNEEDRIPDTLREAIHSFVLAVAARRARGQDSVHSTMLVHVTRFNDVQGHVCRQVSDEISDLKNAVLYGSGEPLRKCVADLKALWANDFEPTSKRVDEPDCVPVDWEEIERRLAGVVDSIKVRQINGSSADVLDYVLNEENGLNVIAIGGDKLSRGLTLDGLVTSFFLRASQMYDTLMQMGRWFGYRPGYLDLCRIYTTPELQEWFEHLAVANEELRAEFTSMRAEGMTPEEFGQRVLAHPSMLVTSRVKMKSGQRIDIGFSDDTSETVVFSRIAEDVRHNFEAAAGFLVGLGECSIKDPVRTLNDGRVQRWNNTYLWQGVSGEIVAEFFETYRTDASAVRCHSGLLAAYIRKMVARGELGNWMVALISMDGGGDPVEISGCTVVPNERGFKSSDPNKVHTWKAEGRYVIRKLITNRDESIDLTADEYGEAIAAIRNHGGRDASIPYGWASRKQRDPDRGLLLLYVLSPDDDKVEGDLPVIGFGVAFPGSRTEEKVSYVVDNLYFNQEYGNET
jgi:hypothetical protein